MPDDPTAINHVGQFCMTPDGQSYAYNYSRGFVDDLYLLEGVR